MGVKTDYSSISINRIHYIDWLRNLAVILLIPFHTARIFDIWEPFYTKNVELSKALSGFIGFLAIWHMPLLFFLAGAASWFALGRRTSSGYLKERTKRLLIPLIFGILVIVPPQVYIARLTHGQVPGSYWLFYPDFFKIDPHDLTGYFGTFTPAHLWFILFLFVFSMIMLPIFIVIRQSDRSRILPRWIDYFSRPGTVYLLALPLALSEALPDLGGKNPFTYVLIFFYGYLSMAIPRFRESFEQNRWTALILGALSSVAILAIWLLDVNIPDWSPGSIVLTVIRNFSTWCWLVALMGLGSRYLDFGNCVLGYSNEAAYPVYILHQTVIVIIGYIIVSWSSGIWLKFIFINLSALIATLILYEVFVRHFNLSRILFGMKPSHNS